MQKTDTAEKNTAENCAEKQKEKKHCRKTVQKN